MRRYRVYAVGWRAWVFDPDGHCVVTYYDTDDDVPGSARRRAEDVARTLNGLP